MKIIKIIAYIYVYVYVSNGKFTILYTESFVMIGSSISNELYCYSIDVDKRVRA